MTIDTHYEAVVLARPFEGEKTATAGFASAGDLIAVKIDDELEQLSASDATVFIVGPGLSHRIEAPAFTDKLVEGLGDRDLVLVLDVERFHSVTSAQPTGIEMHLASLGRKVTDVAFAPGTTLVRYVLSSDPSAVPGESDSVWLRAIGDEYQRRSRTDRSYADHLERRLDDIVGHVKVLDERIEVSATESRHSADRAIRADQERAIATNVLEEERRARRKAWDEEREAWDEEREAWDEEREAWDEERTRGELALAERDTEVAQIQELLAESEAKLGVSHIELEREKHERSNDLTRFSRDVASLQASLGAVVSERDYLDLRIEQLENRIRKLERDRAKLRHRLSVDQWKIRSMRNRRWWRLGGAVGTWLRRPWKMIAGVRGVTSALFTRVPTRAKPLAPELPAAPPPSRPLSAAPVEYLSSGLLAAPSSMTLAPRRPRRTRELRVAVIMDEMTTACFAPECDLITFAPHNWLDVLEREQPHFLLVESAWRGNDGAWEYKVGSYSYPDSVGLPDLSAVIDWCKERSIPTIFWNKEDPVHFEKFKSAAKLFDVILTTDSRMIDRYRDIAPEAVVDALPFAAQPALHHPVGMMGGQRDHRPVFAGAYYLNRHQHRRGQLDMLLDAAMESNLVIYDRMGGATSDSFGFPERFQSHIVGSVPYTEMAALYRRSRVFLNVNSVHESPTMFSRRVFELLASGTAVVSTPSVGITELLGDSVTQVDTGEEASEAIGALVSDDAAFEKSSEEGIDRILESHTYGHRLHTIATHAGLDLVPILPAITFFAVPDMLEEVLAARESTDRVICIYDADEDLPEIDCDDVTLLGADPDGCIPRLYEIATDWVMVIETPEDLVAVDVLRHRTLLRNAEAIAATGEGESYVFTDTVGSVPALVSSSLVSEHGWRTDLDWQRTVHHAGARFLRTPGVM